MIPLVLLVTGGLLAVVAATVGVAATSVRRVDLYRWVVQRRPGARAAGLILGAPWRIQWTANLLVSVGLVLGLLGAGPMVVALPWPLALLIVGGVVVPATATVVYAVPRALGRRWPEAVVASIVPWVDRLALFLSALLPEGLARQDREFGARGSADVPLGDGEASKEAELPVLSGVLAFAERTAREVMTPRTDVVAVREGASIAEIAQLIADSGYSRIPVYRDSLDNIVGMVYAFDLLKLSPGAALPLRPVATAPESKRCADLLFEMQRQRRHLAVLLDEYGGTAGIATLEDLLEELVGEIFDEFDGRSASEPSVGELMDVAGSTRLEEIEARFGIGFGGAAETVGGLLGRAAGRIPRAGERLVVGELEFDVLQATPSRVERVVVRRAGVPVVQLVPPESR